MRAIFVALMLTFTTGAAHGADRIAVVDLQKALLSVNDGKKAKSDLKKQVDKQQKAIDGRQEDLKKLKQQLETQGMLMKDEQRKSLQLEFQKKLMELQQIVMESQKGLAQQEALATKKIIEKMQRIVKKIAAKEGFTLVLVNSGDNIIFYEDKYDITNQVIRLYDKAK